MMSYGVLFFLLLVQVSPVAPAFHFRRRFMSTSKDVHRNETHFEGFHFDKFNQTAREETEGAISELLTVLIRKVGKENLPEFFNLNIGVTRCEYSLKHVEDLQEKHQTFSIWVCKDVLRKYCKELGIGPIYGFAGRYSRSRYNVTILCQSQRLRTSSLNIVMDFQEGSNKPVYKLAPNLTSHDPTRAALKIALIVFVPSVALISLVLAVLAFFSKICNRQTLSNDVNDCETGQLEMQEIIKNQ